jgi:hypothetical protein
VSNQHENKYHNCRHDRGDKLWKRAVDKITH